jgi:hypothetical protein
MWFETANRNPAAVLPLREQHFPEFTTVLPELGKRLP